MKLQDYVKQINTRYRTGISREHSYRGDLQSLLSNILPDVLVTNEPARIKCGAPDFILTKKDIPLGYIEAKDIGIDLKSKTQKEQFDRYRASLNNLIFTDYLDFHFYKDGNFVTRIAIARIQGSKIIPLPENFDTFTQLIKNFAATISLSIKSPTKLAEMMASRAKLMADVIEKSLNADDEHDVQSPLKGQMLTFKNVLIQDITNRAFADIYAQTIAYGMFAARYHDPTLLTFSRQEAATLIPKSNPFLRRLFQDIAGYDLDDRLVWIVDELVQIFLASDVADIMRNFGSRTKQEDPVIHFYENFLAAYDPALRKARGVWYTPEPVVNFIVRAVDEILQTEFGLPKGLADTSKTKIKVNTNGKQEEKEVHRVKILDPATGTGTFLAEVIKQIYSRFEGQQGVWSNYVENDLIPRLNGFELLMASYSMAHLKLDLLLTATGYKPTRDQRLRVYLTNSLEESHPDTGLLFHHWLSDEANAANQIKKDAPVMVVLGNPPYAVSSSNKGSWILNLITDYKKGLNERKLNLDDDYIKFIRFGQYYIDKNGEGILAYISNNSFVDGVTHRRMRTSLLESFDKLYVLNLHGNAKKKETTSEGLPDQNVFDIMQGVSINIFIKTGRKKKDSLGEVLYLDLLGKREIKYELLDKNNLSSLPWRNIPYKEPFNFFSPVNYSALTTYNSGFLINEFFLDYNSGIQTKNDPLTIKYNSEELESVVNAFKTMSKAELIQTLGIQDSAGWKIDSAKADIIQNKGSIIDIQYKIFDYRKTYFTGKSSGFIGRTRGSVMVNMQFDNIALIFKRTGKVYGSSYDFFFVSKCVISEGLFAIDPLGREYLAPLYNYTMGKDQLEMGFQEKRTPNLNANIILKIVDKIGLRFTNEKETGQATFAPIDLLDYIYAVFHSPTYRETYKDFLKIDFPRVPYPKDAPTFWALVALGSELRHIHLMESTKLEKYFTQYPANGDNIVGKIKYENCKVYINDVQYFANVPLTAWKFYIGGYQPAQKWLKDRRGRELGFEDILHYQKIIVALVETDRIMNEIDTITLE